MFRAKFNNVRIEAYSFDRPPHKVTTAEIEDRLTPQYKKFGIPVGTLEKLSGINNRHMYDRGTLPSDIATLAAKAVMAKSGIDPKEIGAIFNCSVSRDYFEPATAILVHKNLGLPETVMAMDITNACIGFSNGMITMSNLIESGVIRAGLIVAGENLGFIMDNTFKKLAESNGEMTRDRFIKTLPTFTLGSGAVAMILAHKDIATQNHRYIGSVSRSASQHAELCIGNGDFHAHMDTSQLDPLMSTDSAKLISSANKLGARTWPDFSEAMGWKSEEIDHVVCHQVGKQVNEAFYKSQGLPHDREHIVYNDYGNLVSAAMPAALIAAAENNKFMAGDKILLTAYGSGLNCTFSGLVW